MRIFTRLLLALLIQCIGLGHFAFGDAPIDPALNNFLSGQSLEKRIQVIAMIEVPKNNLPMPYRYQRQQVIEYLRNLTTLAAQNLRTISFGAGITAQDIQVKDLFWINLSLSANVTVEGLKALAKAPGIMAIYSNKKIVYPRPTTIVPEGQNDIPRNFVQTGMDRILREMPDLDGRGILVGHIDTGVDASHPALAGKVAAFFNGKTIGQPSDSGSHGTHTAGTILGGNRKDDFIGVAPGAKLVSAGFLRDLDEILRGMQWIMDPDSNPKTDDMPRLVSNSWRVWYDSPWDAEPLYRAVSSWEAAGILPVFAAGNEGPQQKTLGHPSQHPDTVCVGAIGPDDKAADFSSRGPGSYKGKELQKPDISAPGVNIVSSVPGGKYAKFSGTSMATPQVAGAVALILQLNPKLTPPQLREVLKNSSTPTDGVPTGTWNPVYGFGRLDIYKAVKLVQRFTSGGGMNLVNPITLLLSGPLSNQNTAMVSEPVQVPFHWER
jgi:subtilisin family serine protease